MMESIQQLLIVSDSFLIRHCLHCWHWMWEFPLSWALQTFVSQLINSCSWTRRCGKRRINELITWPCWKRYFPSYFSSHILSFVFERCHCVHLCLPVSLLSTHLSLISVSLSVGGVLGSGTLCASWQCLEVPRGPPPSLAVQFVGSGASLSGMDVELVGSRYRMSLVKKRFATGDDVNTLAHWSQTIWMMIHDVSSGCYWVQPY